MPRSTEIDSTEVIRSAMIQRRNQALKESNFWDAVLFSHVIAALHYCLELEGKADDKQSNS